MRPIERSLEQRKDTDAEFIRGYCLAIRSALTDDGRPPLSATGRKIASPDLVVRDAIRVIALVGFFESKVLGSGKVILTRKKEDDVRKEGLLCENSSD